jgi:hypothetical protein
MKAQKTGTRRALVRVPTSLERKMNFLRGTCLLLTITLVSLGAPAFAQQEVDPDHFDQPATKAAVKAPINSSMTHKRVHGKTSAANHHAKSQASKRAA